MKRTLSLLILIVALKCLAAQEIVYENHAGTLYGTVVIPYESIIFPKDQEQSTYTINLEIKNSKGKWISAIRDHQLFLPQRQWLNDTAIPIDFELKLDPGTYKANLKLRNKQAGVKKQLSREIVVSKQDSEIGFSWIRAQRDSVIFIPSMLESFGEQYLRLDYRQRFSLAIDSLRIAIGNQKLVINEPVSPVVLDLSPYLQPERTDTIIFSIFEGNIQYNLDPFLYTPWFSYSIRYTPEDQLAQLRYIASQNEWQILSHLPDSKHVEAIDGFWNKHDPSPGTLRNESREQFSERVIKADEKFTIHKRLQGWKSDRGRIYIKYGEPDDIVSEVFSMGRYPSVIWSYYKEDRRFIFADTKGYGQYTLRNKQDEY